MLRRLIICGAAAAGCIGECAELHAGDRLAIDDHHASWTYHSWAYATGNDAAAGRMPLFSWSAAPRTTAAAIASGSQDSVIVAAATATAATGRPIYLRPFYEFDQPVGHPR